MARPTAVASMESFMLFAPGLCTPALVVSETNNIAPYGPVLGAICSEIFRCELSDTLTQPKPQNNPLSTTTLVSQNTQAVGRCGHTPVLSAQALTRNCPARANAAGSGACRSP